MACTPESCPFWRNFTLVKESLQDIDNDPKFGKLLYLQKREVLEHRLGAVTVTLGIFDKFKDKCPNANLCVSTEGTDTNELNCPSISDINMMRFELMGPTIGPVDPRLSPVKEAAEESLRGYL